MEELRDSVVSGRFKLLPVLLRVRTAAEPEELKKSNKDLRFTMNKFKPNYQILIHTGFNFLRSLLTELSICAAG